MATVIDENLNKILSARYGEEVRGAIHDAIEQCYNNVDSDLNLKTFGIKVYDGSADETAFDANNAPENSFGLFVVTQNGKKNIVNFPSELIQSKSQIEFVFLNFGTNSAGSHQLIVSIIKNKIFLYAREHEHSWDPWFSLKSDDRDLVTKNQYSNGYIKEIDANEIKGDSINYIISAPQLDGVNNKNFPVGVQKNQAVMTLIALGQSSNNTQTIITDRDFIAYRFSNDYGDKKWTYGPWTKIGRRKIFVSKTNSSAVVKYGNGPTYTSLLEALIDATSDFDNIVYVYPGEYDLIKEYEDYFGSDFFTAYDSSEHEFSKGLVLKNRVTVVFAKGAKVTCMYDGSDRTLSNSFSPFNSGNFGFTLIGAEVHDQNVRYSMHDERAESYDIYVNHYAGCHFYHDKGTGNGYGQTLGGGLGINGLVSIEDCMFRSEGDTGNIVSYHNSHSGYGHNAESFVSIKDSIIDGSVRFSWYGNSTNISKMIVTNCRLLSEPITSRENVDFDFQNVKLYAWNNAIESEPILS